MNAGVYCDPVCEAVVIMTILGTLCGCRAYFLRSRHLSDTACLVADVHMPGMTGVELHRHLVDAGYAIPTILVTVYPDESPGIRL